MTEEQKIIDAVMDEWVKGASIRSVLAEAVRETAKACFRETKMALVKVTFPEAFDRVG